MQVSGWIRAALALVCLILAAVLPVDAGARIGLVIVGGMVIASRALRFYVSRHQEIGPADSAKSN